MQPHATKLHRSNSTFTSEESNASTNSDRVAVSDIRGPDPKTVSRRTLHRPPVIIHNTGGQIFDKTRPSDWDKQRWK
ncbi:hypothetical protein MPDQ_000579 [Monascus purpureus]|uniref:Uncharacterized protein n=1 Tax=Monascus purpureus TaxID=5098 RepID=A0A507R5D7_MONPU|nr:hypothetical protein MPDQ_000579 [Monascus purpureus]BDD64163.1 hypothetical protein MAP00_009007 [Monascus purpureus]